MEKDKTKTWIILIQYFSFLGVNLLLIVYNVWVFTYLHNCKFYIESSGVPYPFTLSVFNFLLGNIFIIIVALIIIFGVFEKFYSWQKKEVARTGIMLLGIALFIIFSLTFSLNGNRIFHFAIKINDTKEKIRQLEEKKKKILTKKNLGAEYSP